MEFAKSVRDGDCSGGAGERTKSQIWAFLNAELGTTEKAGRGLQMSSNTQGRRHRHRSNQLAIPALVVHLSSTIHQWACISVAVIDDSVSRSCDLLDDE
ncbi:hypothetical protein HID58_084709 [Brassica napus]|uniref:Uncharacterized protein n=1 Tax=Brassica napus TaxID=3708 RepID=A0ABQ7XKG7_BRANA|nr:hypothetical protein HID58_084709 [Brassica napus]